MLPSCTGTPAPAACGLAGLLDVLPVVGQCPPTVEHLVDLFRSRHPPSVDCWLQEASLPAVAYQVVSGACKVSQFVGWKPGTESMGLFSENGNLKTKSAWHFKAKHVSQLVGWKQEQNLWDSFQRLDTWKQCLQGILKQNVSVSLSVGNQEQNPRDSFWRVETWKQSQQGILKQNTWLFGSGSILWAKLFLTDGMFSAFAAQRLN